MAIVGTLDSLSKLWREMFDKEGSDGHCIQFMFSYSTLVHNPLAIKHFADQLSSPHGVALAGMVDCHTIEGLAHHPDGKEAGVFAVVNVIVYI